MSSYKITSSDYVIRTTGSATNVTVSTGNLVVDGNLVILGNTSYVDTEIDVLNVFDPNIVLNSNLSSIDSAYGGNSGVIVNRGIDSDTAIFWNEAVDAWQIAGNVADGSTYSNIGTTAGTGTIVDGNQYQVPYYSVSPTGKTLSPAGNLVYTPTGNIITTDQYSFRDTGTQSDVDGVPNTPWPITTDGNVTLAFANVSTAGGTGIFFNNGRANDELISKKKAIVYSIIF
jgi:hypothetical protein